MHTTIWRIQYNICNLLTNTKHKLQTHAWLHVHNNNITCYDILLKLLVLIVPSEKPAVMCSNALLRWRPSHSYNTWWWCLIFVVWLSIPTAAECSSVFRVLMLLGITGLGLGTWMLLKSTKYTDALLCAFNRTKYMMLEKIYPLFFSQFS